jgi:GT2 family glycosyltransferase
VDSLNSPSQDSTDHSPIEVVVLIVAYNGRKDLAECLPTVLASDDSPYLRHVLVVDNASSDDVGDWLAQEFPEVVYYRSEQNLGFAGGNNLGWEVIQQRFSRTKYIALLNQDTVVDSGWLARLGDYLEAHAEVACGQSKLLLHPETTRFNTAGNVCQFLGFGFTTGYRELDEGQYDSPRSIDFPSGAACLVRAESIREFGLFDSNFFLYHEDTELGWKARLAGWDVHYIPDSVVYHKYVYKGDFRNYYYLERNRLWLLFVHYRWPTLLLIAPAALLMEAGQLAFAFTRGRLRDKLRSYAYFCQRDNLVRLRQRRRESQAKRKISDREFLGRFKGGVEFSELRSPVLRWVANPILNAYWSIARRLIFW